LGLARASLVGNSMGAGLAIGMALEHPDRVERLVLLAGLPDHVTDKLASPLVKRSVESRAPIWLVELGNWLAGWTVTEKVLKEIIHDHTLLTPLVLERSYHNRRRPGLVRALLTMARQLPEWETGYARRLGEIRHAPLILWGTDDQVFPLQVGRELHAAIPRSEFVEIPDAGHIPQWERPDAVNAILADYLQP
ncbi:MAG: alpha/beta fold hydrolase, partial [Nitrospirales bacterium]